MSASDLDWVHIEGLQIDTVIGVYEWEQQQTQRLLIDLAMAWDIQAAAQKDDIEQALDYAKVTEAVTAWVQQKPRQLIETVAEGIAQLVLQQFGVREVEVKVSKPGAVPSAANVAVSISRRQFDSPFG
ncbi:dihydroneopterin aldolase [Idiomarina aquatica]|uniref:7,8-dihydroneopterin aldolase n=1 Tax=Idiomarina aquatica TaxID=1327752 RepID=A0AA94EE44_9GAMM|nr:dihydroneopterin aldolase [Idiomarina aquatica]RUO39680.1 dihydroneopterin aldolase [Idiomarina aquatica]